MFAHAMAYEQLLIWGPSSLSTQVSIIIKAGKEEPSEAQPVCIPKSPQTVPLTNSTIAPPGA